MKITSGLGRKRGSSLCGIPLYYCKQLHIEKTNYGCLVTCGFRMRLNLQVFFSFSTSNVIYGLIVNTILEFLCWVDYHFGIFSWAFYHLDYCLISHISIVWSILPTKLHCRIVVHLVKDNFTYIAFSSQA